MIGSFPKASYLFSMNSSSADVAAYIWPSYHHEPRLAHWWEEGDGEWVTVRAHQPRWPGHEMPKIPLLGYQDEADPAVMRQHIDLALEYGVNVFIMDWYWYDDAPCFERQLNEGLLPAIEGTDMRFFLMWANHDATSLWDRTTDANDLLYSAATDREQFERIWTRNLEKYLTHPHYYRIDGKPVVSIFLLRKLVSDFGGIPATRDAFAWLQEKAKSFGLPGVHLQAIHWQIVPHESREEVGELMDVGMAELIRVCGFDSCTNYQMVQAAPGNIPYADFAQTAVSTWEKDDAEVPSFFPHVSVGWDNTHRNPGMQEGVTERSPALFQKAFQQALDFLDTHPDRPRLITVNSWNEWTEDSYLLPDEQWGYRYLEAIRDSLT